MLCACEGTGKGTGVGAGVGTDRDEGEDPFLIRARAGTRARPKAGARACVHGSYVRAQVDGEKRFLLVSPSESLGLYSDFLDDPYACGVGRVACACRVGM